MFIKLYESMALRYCLAVTIVLIIAPSTHGWSNNTEYKCTEGLLTPGITIPRGDIVVEYESPLEIYCALSDMYVKLHGVNASRKLGFYRHDDKLPDEMVEIVNSSTIKMFIKKPPVSKSIYYCKLDDGQVVCLNNVAIGTKPQNVTDFKCIGLNYDNLTCSWTAPENYVKTTYSLTYHFPGRSSRVIYSCPVTPYLSGVGDMKCFWDIRSEPHYRQAQPIFFFTLTMNNTFGTNVISTKFTHFERVIPSPPDNLTLVSTTYNSITIRWAIPTSMLNFPPGLDHRVLFQSEYENRDEWQLAEIIDEKKSSPVEYTLKNLKYAHAHYDIRVSMRSKDAKFDDESMWSKNSSLVITTSSTVPSSPPKTTVGSFEIVNLPNTKREVYIYWQQIPGEMQNGENFSYDIKIQGIDDNYNYSVLPNEITSAYARFKDLNTTVAYKFLIRSKNEIGDSLNESFVYVPSRIERIPEPTSFTKIAFNGGVYELSWDAPVDHNITNYTIFWCNNDRDRPYQCKGQLNWTVVNSSVHIHNITLPETKVYQFAIAANSNNSSSGMVWAACTVIHNKSFGKMKSVWISKIGSTFIEVGWKLECSDRIGSVEGFIIYYCPIVSPKESSCKGPQQNISITGDPSVMHANVSRLNPYTTYMLSVSVITKHNTQSQPSEPMFNTTLEAAPESYPNGLEVTNITNTSMTVRWAAPTAKNGVIRYYQVKYNGRIQQVDAHNGMENTEVILTGLDSYQKYNVTVIACTVACSEPAPEKSAQTLIGVPGQMYKPYVNAKNDSYMKVEWKPPMKSGGEINGYELRIRVLSENITKVVKTNETSYKFEDCTKENGHKTYYFAVRAVNTAENYNFRGPWSEETENFCHQPPEIYIYVGGFLIVGLFSFFIYMSFTRILACYKRIKDVEAKLPPGLSTLETLDRWTEHCPGDHNVQHTITETDLDRGPLLQRSSEKGSMGSRDSSGCSSGNPSVTSSLESEPPLSNMSDSGTEQTRSPSLDESRRNSYELRRRNKEFPSRGYIQMASDGLNQSNLKGNKLNPRDNYCVIGDVTESPPGYMAESMKKPFASGTISKTTDFGYLPINHLSNTAEQNTPYVKAGNEVCLGLIASKKNSIQDLMILEPVEVNPKVDSRIEEVNQLKREDIKPPYVQVANVTDIVPNYMKTGDILGLKDDSTDRGDLSWSPAAPTKGYVAFGEVPARPQMEDVSNKGYVPHRQFDAKTLKED